MNVTTDVATIAPIGHDEAMALTLVEYERIAAGFAAVGPKDWSRPTDCELWTVRDLGGHLVGAMQGAASLRETLRQNRIATKRSRKLGGQMVDHLTALQVETSAHFEPSALVAEMARLVAPAVAGRRRIPGLARRLVSMRIEVGSISERWSLGYLIDVILTRDVWMHRVDLARALGTEPVLDAAHDGRVVADVVAEWARRHGKPFHLELSGPAGGDFSGVRPGANDPQPPTIQIDAVEFCRRVSGRATGEGLLAQEVPF